jgi:hypothetical protein
LNLLDHSVFRVRSTPYLSQDFTFWGLLAPSDHIRVTLRALLRREVSFRDSASDAIKSRLLTYGYPRASADRVLASSIKRCGS